MWDLLILEFSSTYLTSSAQVCYIINVKPKTKTVPEPKYTYIFEIKGYTSPHTHTHTDAHSVQALISFSASVLISTGCKRLGNKVKQGSLSLLPSLHLFPHSLLHSSLFYTHFIQLLIPYNISHQPISDTPHVTSKHRRRSKHVLHRRRHVTI